jgi:predicted nucleotidyltransferase
MRLSKFEVKTIKDTILNHIQDAKILLFGSRIYDNRKGGDIDILVQTSSKVSLKDKIDILTQLEISGIERKVDLIFKTPYIKEQNIVKTALREGILL